MGYGDRLFGQRCLFWLFSAKDRKDLTVMDRLFHIPGAGGGYHIYRDRNRLLVVSRLYCSCFGGNLYAETFDQAGLLFHEKLDG